MADNVGRGFGTVWPPLRNGKSSVEGNPIYEEKQKSVSCSFRLRRSSWR
jgi:hypothetical protein